jgi:hypothetical protein
MPRTAAVLPCSDLSPADSLPAADRLFLLSLQHEALHYFLENQHPCGLVLDRQSNHSHRRAHGLCSTAATGMGFIALALAAAPPYRLLSLSEARLAVRRGLEAIRDRLPHDFGVIPHFIHSTTWAIHGTDPRSTIETAWVAAGGLWAAAFLEDAGLEALAADVYGRIDWSYWTTPGTSADAGLLCHGKALDGRFLPWCWDRLNGETAFMYILAVGADAGQAVAPDCWSKLRTYPGTVAGLRFNNADLGLFVFQYGLDLLDLDRWRAPGETDLWAEAGIAAHANERACRAAADHFATYRSYWGLSAGDGPGEPTADDVYRAYSPAGPVDGTAHLTASLASVVHRPDAVLDNLHRAQADQALHPHGRYGFSGVNIDRGWVGRDMVGIDAGAAVLALDNFLHQGRVRAVFHGLPCVRRALERLRFFPCDNSAPGLSTGEPPPTCRQAC